MRVVSDCVCVCVSLHNLGALHNMTNRSLLVPHLKVGARIFNLCTVNYLMNLIKVCVCLCVYATLLLVALHKGRFLQPKGTMRGNNEGGVGGGEGGGEGL